jgi:hypothetical protein
MDYRGDKIEVVIDWVEVEIQLSDRSNFWTVQGHLREALQLPEGSKPGVDPLDATETGSASAFRFRVQDPRCMNAVTEALAALGERFNIETVRVVAIEVAFDTYRDGATKKGLAEIVADRYRFSSRPPPKGCYWHLYRRKGEKAMTIGRATRLGKLDNVERPKDLLSCLADEWQIADCEDRGRPDIRFHGYVKAWNDGGPITDPKQWCARWEVTLRNSKLPFSSLQELAQFDFTKLSQYFSFCRFGDDVLCIVRHALATTSVAQLGMKGSYPRANRSGGTRLYAGTRSYRRSMVADEMNKVIHDSCLKKLNRQWRGA